MEVVLRILRMQVWNIRTWIIAKLHLFGWLSQFHTYTEYNTLRHSNKSPNYMHGNLATDIVMQWTYRWRFLIGWLLLYQVHLLLQLVACYPISSAENRGSHHLAGYASPTLKKKLQQVIRLEITFRFRAKWALKVLVCAFENSYAKNVTAKK